MKKQQPRSHPSSLDLRSTSLIRLLLLLIGCLGCTDDAFLDEGLIPPRQPYSGPITVINRSQFTYTGFYLHSARNPVTLENLLEQPLARGASIQVEVVPRLYFSASRPKVERGREWLIQTAAPVTFYGNQPVLLVLDQSFMVIDPSIPLEPDSGPSEGADRGQSDRRAPDQSPLYPARPDQGAVDHALLDQAPRDQNTRDQDTRDQDTRDQDTRDQGSSDLARSDLRMDHGERSLDLMQPEAEDQHQRGEGDGDSSPPLDRSPDEGEGLTPGGGAEDAG